MPSDDRWGYGKVPCPYCGAMIYEWYFGCDDSYAPASWGQNCKSCGRTFTDEEFEKIKKFKIRNKHIKRKVG